MTLLTDEYELFHRIRSGDKAACAQCIELHSPDVYRLAMRLLGDPTEAEDVVQETFTNAFHSIQSFEGRSGLKTWLYRIAMNAALGRLRKHPDIDASVEDIEADEAGITPEQLFDWCCLPEPDFDSQEAHEQIAEAIAALPESLRQVFLLRELEGLSTQDTAEALGISQENVKVRLHRARMALRETLSGYFIELMDLE